MCLRLFLHRSGAQAGFLRCFLLSPDKPGDVAITTLGQGKAWAWCRSKMASRPASRQLQHNRCERVASHSFYGASLIIGPVFKT